MPDVVMVVVTAVGVTFALAAVSKLRAISVFQESLRTFELIPDGAIVKASYAIAFVEASVAMSLLSGFLVGLFSVVALGLTIAFGSAAATAKLRGLSPKCACLSQRDSTITSAKGFARIGFLLCGTSSAVVYSVHDPDAVSSGWIALITAPAVVLACAWLLEAIDAIKLLRKRSNAPRSSAATINPT